MSIKTSFSQSSTFVKCPMHWKWKYREKYEPLVEGASLYFGSAVDSAVMHMLEAKMEGADPNKERRWDTIFSDRWFSTTKGRGKNAKVYQIFDSPNIIYSNDDFDEHVLDEEDKVSIKNWMNELKIGKDNDPIEFIKEVCSKKKSKYKKPTSNEMRFFNRCSWLSMHRKGLILIEHFYKTFYPKIKKVYKTQEFAMIKDNQTGDTIMGALDFVAEIEGYDKKIIFDLKTSARPYTEENIDLSEQLPLYLALSKGQYNTNLVGYVVLVKNIRKLELSYCKSCGNKKTGRHKTCDAVVNGERCGGEWQEKIELQPYLQEIVREKTQEQVDSVLRDQGAILSAMKNDIVYRNLDACGKWYGSKCAFYDACHNNTLKGLRKKY